MTMAGVLGYGVVGKATAEVLRRLGHSVAVWDVDGARLAEARKDGYGFLRVNRSPDILFLCVPETHITAALETAPRCPITVIRSTVTPGTTDRLSMQLSRPLAFVPETLREATALSDALSPAFILIGSHSDEQARTLADLFAPLLAPTAIVPPSTAEMVKLSLNAYLHTQVSFWNEVHGICSRVGIPSHVIGKLCSQDPRVSAYGAIMHGRPVDGRCLPKDLAQFIAFARDVEYEPELFATVQRENDILAARQNGSHDRQSYAASAAGPQLSWHGATEMQRGAIPSSSQESRRSEEDVRWLGVAHRQTPADKPRNEPPGHGLYSAQPPARGEVGSAVVPLQGRAEKQNRDTQHSRRRIALYSHDTMGLGHKRRNLLIAQALAGSELKVDVLLIVGDAEATNTSAFPAGVDCLSLPALRKEEDGRYRSRSLQLSLEETVRLRARVISAALEAFAPDVLIVDKEPRGALRELDPALERLRTRGRALCVLGMREVLDDPDTVRREWRRTKSQAAIRRYYDAIWVYGDPMVYDPIHEYRFPADLAAKVRYTGYLDQRMRVLFAARDGVRLSAPKELPSHPFALCLLGGGQDGAQLADAFARAELPADTHGVILTGPFLPHDAQANLRQLAGGSSRLHVFGFLDEPAPLMERADRVVAMGGYNTIAEVLSFEKRALIVPRVKPRREQLIRAERLRDLGVVDVLHPDELSPRALTAWLARDFGPPRAHERIDMNGLGRIPALLADLLSVHPSGARAPASTDRVNHAS